MTMARYTTTRDRMTPAVPVNGQAPVSRQDRIWGGITAALFVSLPVWVHFLPNGI